MGQPPKSKLQDHVIMAIDLEPQDHMIMAIDLEPLVSQVPTLK